MRGAVVRVAFLILAAPARAEWRESPISRSTDAPQLLAAHVSERGTGRVALITGRTIRIATALPGRRFQTAKPVLGIGGEEPPVLGFDGDGHAVVAWEEHGRISAAVQIAGGRWGGRIELGKGSAPRLAVGENGQAIVAWSRGRQLYAAIRDWRPHRLARDASNVAVDIAGGRALFAWMQDGRIMTRTGSGPARSLGSYPEPSELTVDLDPAGRGVVAFYAFEDDQSVAYAARLGGRAVRLGGRVIDFDASVGLRAVASREPVVLTPGLAGPDALAGVSVGLGALQPIGPKTLANGDLAVARDGRPLVVWGGERVQVSTPSGPPETISTRPGGDPVIAVGAGRTVAAWVTTDGIDGAVD